MKLVLLDLDNTLIDANYNLTVPREEFHEVVRELSDRNIHIGLCSDSAVITLKQWSDHLGLTGPTIAERGAVIWDPIKQKEEVLNASATSWFPELRDLFIKNTLRELPGATIMIGDATRFVKEKKMSPALTEQILAVNGFRNASFSFFAYRPGENRTSIVPDTDLLARTSNIVSEAVESLNRTKKDLFWDENPKYGVLIVHAYTTEKWRGASFLMDHYKPEQTVMIGDGVSDLLGLDNVAQHAVGNADPQYKERSTFVSEYSLTEGVIECLRQL